MPLTASVIYPGSGIVPAQWPDLARTGTRTFPPSIVYAAGQILADVPGAPGMAAAYPGTLQAPPAGPTVTDSSGAGSVPVTPILVGVSFITPTGETSVGPLTSFTPAGAHKLHVATISLTSPATGLNVYAGYSASTLIRYGTSSTGTAADYDVPTVSIPPASLKQAVPAAPTVTDSSASGTVLAVPTFIGLTYLTATGESGLSLLTTFTPAGSKKLHVATVTLPDEATGINVYAGENENQLFLWGTSSTGTAADYDVPTLQGKSPPTADTSAPATCILQYPISTDINGLVALGGLSGVGEHGAQEYSAPVYEKGYFNCADLTGLDAAAVTQLGKLLGPLSTGRLEVV